MRGRKQKQLRKGRKEVEEQRKVKERVGEEKKGGRVLPVFIEEAADPVRHKHIHFSIYVNDSLINIY
jgi:hypothetical protein